MTAPRAVWLTRVKAIAGLDIHVAFTLLLRGWGILAGTLSVLLIPLFLSPVEQGYYYTFSSLLALQILFELGLNQVVIQLVSHEVAHLEVRGNGSVGGDAQRVYRLAALVRLLRRWYAVMAVLFGLVIGAAGYAFLAHQGQVLPPRHWALAWLALVACTAVNLYFSPLLAVIEGTGNVGRVARLRLVQSVLGYTTMWLLLVGGVGLWVTVAAPAVTALVSAAWLRERAPMFRWLRGLAPRPGATFIWKRDVFPLQWRIGLSWISGYLSFSAFTPIVFATHGAVDAGQLGMTMAVLNGALTLGVSWVNAKAPVFTMHISRGESAQLNRLFRALTIRSTLFTAAAALTIVAMVAIGAQVHWSPIRRMADPWTVLWIASATTTNVLVYAAATYMRAHREEPMLPVSVVSAVVTMVLLSQASRLSLATLMACFAAITVCISLPWTMWLLRGYRRRHAMAVRV